MEQFISHLCKNAGRILLKHFGTNLDWTEKKDAGFVTIADLESEQYIINEIKKTYPGSDIMAEESGEDIKNNKLRWIIDPLDGTTNYGNGIPFFAVSIAMEEDGILTAGAIYNPVAEEFFYAEKGKGFKFNNNSVKIGIKKDLEKSVLSTGDCYYRGDKFHTSLDIFNRIYNKCRVVRVPGSVSLSLAYTASGKFDGFWLEEFNYWDVAAGILMVQEAGGVITDNKGRNLNKKEHSFIIGTNEFLLHQIIEII